MKQFFKKSAYILITLVLLFALFGIGSYRGVTAEELPWRLQDATLLGRWDATLLEGVYAPGYQVAAGEGSVTFTPNGADPQIHVGLDHQPVNLVVLTFAGEAPQTLGEKLYYSTDGSFTEQHTAQGVRVGERLFFCFPSGSESSILRVDFDGEVTLTELSAYSLSAPATWQPSYVAIGLLFGGLLLLALPFVEKRFGYFAWLLTPVRREFDRVRALLAEGRKKRAALRIATMIMTALDVGFVAVCIVGGFYEGTLFLIAFACTVLAVALQIATHAQTHEYRTTATLFLAVAVLVGLLLCYTMPSQIGVSWDDETHFRRAYNWVHIFGDDCSVSEYNLIRMLYSINGYVEDPAAAIASMEQWNGIRVDYTPTMCNPYTALSYLPAMLSIAAASVFDYDTVTMITLCRLANLLTYAIVIYLGIRKLKSGAVIFSAVALLPTALFLACSINYDFWLTAWLAFALAHLLSVLQREGRTFKKGDICIILIGFFLACAPKAIYCFLMLPLLFLPKKRFRTPRAARSFRWLVVLTVAFVVATLALPALVVPDLYTDTRGGSDVSSGGQIAFILSNPFRYAGILFKFLGEFCSISNMNTNAVYYAYLGSPYVFFGTIAVFLLLYAVYTDRRERDGYEGMQTLRWISLGTAFLQLVLVVTSLYVGFTPVGSETVNGCSYRYIFPILLSFCFFMAPKGIKCAISPRFQNTFVYGGLALNLLATFFGVYLIRFI